MPEQYDYIIAGAGCAGSSLLLRMVREPFFRDKKILVVDQARKNTNDRTWCFWEKKPGIFEPIVYHRWNELDFYSDLFSAPLSISPYQYKMIRSADLYGFVAEEAARHAHVQFRQGNVQSITTENGRAVAVIDGETFTAGFAFNSIVRKDFTHIENESNALLQHFRGRLINTPQAAFNPERATFMDFRVGQEEGTTFVYVLPVTEHTALVEYTLFTQQLLAPQQYDDALQQYISQTLHIDTYDTLHEESGVIPMTDERFPLQQGPVVYIGVAGGQVKGSSGYAFQFIQKRADQVVKGLMEGRTAFDHTSLNDRKFHLYDRVLLHVLAHNKMRGADVFACIFKRNPPERVLQFLDNESSFVNDLRIMQSVPASVFVPAALRSLW